MAYKSLLFKTTTARTNIVLGPVPMAHKKEWYVTELDKMMMIMIKMMMMMMLMMMMMNHDLLSHKRTQLTYTKSVLYYLRYCSSSS